MTDLTLADKGFTLWNLLAEVKDTIAKARRKELATYGIPMGRAYVLFAIRAIGKKARPTDIARLTCRETHSVSEMLIRMEKEGLVRKTKDLAQKDHVRIRLTDKGRRMYHHTTHRESIKRIISCLSEKEQEQLSSYLYKLLDQAQKEVDEEMACPQ